MTTYIQRTISDVSVEPEPADAVGNPGDIQADMLEEMKRTRERCERIELRTRAESFDD